MITLQYKGFLLSPFLNVIEVSINILIWNYNNLKFIQLFQWN